MVYLKDHTLITDCLKDLQDIIKCLSLCESPITHVNGIWTYYLVGERAVINARNLNVIPTYENIDSIIDKIKST